MGTDNPPVKDTLTVQQLENAAKAAQHGTGPYLESGSFGEGEGTVGGHGVEFSTLSIMYVEVVPQPACVVVLMISYVEVASRMLSSTLGRRWLRPSALPYPRVERLP